MLSPSLLIIFFGIFVASYVVWALFRIEQYEETRVIDVILLVGTSALVGGRGVWLWQHWHEIDHTIQQLFSISLHEFSLNGLVFVPLVTISVLLYKIDWPYLISLDRIATGGLFLGLFTSLGLGYQNIEVPFFPFLLQGQETYVSAWLVSLMYVFFIGLWFFILRKYAKPGYVFGLFLLGTLRISLVLTGLLAWLIIRYSYLWQKKKQKNN